MAADVQKVDFCSLWNSIVPMRQPCCFIWESSSSLIYFCGWNKPLHNHTKKIVDHNWHPIIMTAGSLPHTTAGPRINFVCFNFWGVGYWVNVPSFIIFSICSESRKKYFFQFLFKTIKTLIIYWISRSDLTGGVTTLLQRQLKNTNVVKIV